MHYYFDPEVSGGFGEDTVIDTSTHPPIVSKLHYLFDGWLGSDIIESFPCFLITEECWNLFKKSSFSGANIDSVLISKSDQFNEIYPDKELPIFNWLKVNGKAGEDDFGISIDNRLVISEKDS